MYNFKVNTREIKTTSEFLNGLVADYRDGLPGSSEALLDAFEPLLSKYQCLLLDGHWDTADKDIGKFLRLMGGSDPVKTAFGLSKSVRKQCDIEDIRQELVCALLQTAQKYTNISYNFKFMVRDRLRRLLSDIFVYDRSSNAVEPDDAPAEALEQIDNSWIVGVTAGDGWDQLSTVQRAIIKYIYNDGLAEAVAARKLKMGVRQLQRLKKSARAVLAEYFHIQEAAHVH